MKVEIIQCNQCRARTEDFYRAIGWIRLEISGSYNSLAITIADGRKKGGEAKSKYRTVNTPLEFCSIKCLSNFIMSVK